MKVLIRLVVEAIIAAILNMILKAKQTAQVAKAKLLKEKSDESVKTAKQAAEDFDAMYDSYKSNDSASERKDNL